ncbi:hypothetical protein DFH08DRAFT_679801 [Mycena albidolilacea]|uniref:Uncharacterized protein n=1 Tax=Mycena albidolilacea TaxID=1033008 RepID=A0AAD7F4S7_9AGAR|nr:hypothetical protein DFH08DRAFT_679801 [Mycena albidolilacea]
MSQPTFSFTTTADEVATAFKFASEIRGKNVLITGISVNGLGFETARVLAKHANLVIITGYNSEIPKIAEDAIKNEVPSANVRPLILDLSSLAAVRRAAATHFRSRCTYAQTGQVLINNTATTIGPFKFTADNIKSQFATNRIRPFLLTKLLSSKPLQIPTRTAQYASRVVFYIGRRPCILRWAEF